MKSYWIFQNNYSESQQIAAAVQKHLEIWGFVLDKQNPNYVFVVGGDGTMLKALEYYNQSFTSICFIPIKSGSLGFYSTFYKDDYLEALEQITSQNLDIKEYPVLKAQWSNICRYILNEIKIIDNSKTLRIKIFVNEELLEFFRGSGLVFSTPTGSTGYMKSIQGSIIACQSSLVWEMKEIAPVFNSSFSTINSPIIFDKSQTIRLEGELKDKLIIADTFEYVCDTNELKIELSTEKIKVVYNKKNNKSLVARLKDIFSLNGNHNF